METEMEILESVEDIFTLSRHVSARVIDTHLDLEVKFDKKILEGKAILNIEMYERNEIILDSNNLTVISVKDFITKSSLPHKCTITDDNTIGSIYIQLPKIQCYQNPNTCQKSEYLYIPRCKIEIEYRTKENCPALLWLTPNQTADNTHHFLFSNIEYIHPRAMFPCQDTPNVKFTYSAMITAQKGFVVIMSAPLKKIFETQKSKVTYEFVQTRPIPAYGVLIAVGSLKKAVLSPRSNVYAETKYLRQSKKTFRNIENIWEIVENLCGFSWGTYNICVLPPSISLPNDPPVKVGPNVVFVSMCFLLGDISLVYPSFVYEISHMWTDYLITCANYNHLWLNKSLGIFIYKKIINKMSIHENIQNYYIHIIKDNLQNKIKMYKNTVKLPNLIPNLKETAFYVTKYIPYEIGYMLLDQLEHDLGGPSIFEPFLKSSLHKFAQKSINTKNWMTYLYDYFHEKEAILNSIEWNKYFFSVDISNFSFPTHSLLDVSSFNLMNEWVKWDNSHVRSNRNLPDSLNVNPLSDIEKILLLTCLHSSSDCERYLNYAKLSKMCTAYKIKKQNYIWFHWLRLGIKYRYLVFITYALDFITQFPLPFYTHTLFNDLYEWEVARPSIIEYYKSFYSKFLYQTQIELKSLFQLESITS